MYVKEDRPVLLYMICYFTKNIEKLIDTVYSETLGYITDDTYFEQQNSNIKNALLILDIIESNKVFEALYVRLENNAKHIFNATYYPRDVKQTTFDKKIRSYIFIIYASCVGFYPYKLIKENIDDLLNEKRPIYHILSLEYCENEMVNYLSQFP